MATIEQTAPLPVRVLTEEESWRRFDALAREHLDIGGDEFLRRLDANEYAAIVDDPAGHQWVVYLAALGGSVR